MKNSRPVYSTESGKLCSGCGRAEIACQCKKNKQARVNVQGDGIIRVSRETKGRKGKGVTLISGFQGSEDELKTLGKKTEAAMWYRWHGKKWVIEIQGDVRNRIVEVLKDEGQQVKLAGG